MFYYVQTQYQKFTFTVNKWRHFPLCVRIFQGAKQREAPPDRGLRVVRLKSQHYSVDSFCGILLPLSEVTESVGMKLTHTWSKGNSTTAANGTKPGVAREQSVHACHLPSPSPCCNVWEWGLERKGEENPRNQKTLPYTTRCWSAKRGEKNWPCYSKDPDRQRPPDSRWGV